MGLRCLPKLSARASIGGGDLLNLPAAQGCRLWADEAKRASERTLSRKRAGPHAGAWPHNFGGQGLPMESAAGVLYLPLPLGARAKLISTASCETLCTSDNGAPKRDLCRLPPRARWHPATNVKSELRNHLLEPLSRARAGRSAKEHRDLQRGGATEERAAGEELGDERQAIGWRRLAVPP